MSQSFHDSAYTHVRGESLFIDDYRKQTGEVQVFVIGTPKASGRIKNISYDKALEISGVLGIYTAKDFYSNHWGTIKSDQPLLVSDEIGYMNEPAVIVAMSDDSNFFEVKNSILFDIEETNPIFSIDEAILKNEYLVKSTPFIQGDVDLAFKNADKILSGSFESGGQEHFYLESQATIVYPLENNYFEVHSSSQHPTETQHVVAHALGLNFHQVTCVVKRMGGGFGGKESQAAHFAALAALVSYKLKKPARLILNKDDDMEMTGKRHPFKTDYEIAFNNDGLIKGLKAKLFADGGAYTDLTPSILDRAMFHIDGCYFLENCLIEGFAVKTNHHSNTAFRGFGGPQGTLVIESIIEDVAKALNIDSLEIRKKNLYQATKLKTPYGQVLDHNPLPDIFNELECISEYQKIKSEVQSFNQNNLNKRRGVSITGVKFGIAFTARFLNQGNAQVNLHVDGSVQVSTGATEMGQGVNTKIQHVVCEVFQIDASMVKVMPTSTEKNHNTSPTAASSGADLNCQAALNASLEILKRLKWVTHHFHLKILDSHNEITSYLNDSEILNQWKLESGYFVNKTIKYSFNEIVKIAYLNRISLGEYAHFKTENLGFDKEKVSGRAFNYFTNGAAMTLVEIDSFTGEMKILNTHILMDLGRPLLKGIDEGQIAGAFIQGVGWLTTEKLTYNKFGKLLTHSPTTYKIPNIQDVPRKFSINFFEHDFNVVNVKKSKAVGEPPFLLGISVFCAIKNALAYNRSSTVKLNAPATNEAIFDQLIEMKELNP